ncbi:ABC transporter substrate-binding protein [Glaciimonas sp. PCH181]|uniref:ABC transporter substrate-binding protein n=1 Tax=Glaciimonas sp. PCH181 TaxID=2133943 RepID=UPI000D3C5A20|nr:ABC transporter substrate-binding protein [Glaciimonas sp. PCH181]PUA16941.1 amino acid ABC transporter substrate-binding protein [Glaciimonas sp. PCH181]
MKTSLLKVLICTGLAVSALSGLAQPNKVMMVGATPTAVPFNFLDTKTNSLQGAMVDITSALGKELGFTAEVLPTPFNALIPSLQTKKIDMISSAFAITPQRAEVVDFSDVLFTYGEELVVNAKDNTEYKNTSDLKGKVVGVQTGTVTVEPMKSVAGIKELKMYDTMPDMIRDVAIGRIDVAVGDGPVMLYNIENSGAKGVRVPKTYQKQIQIRIAIAVRKGDKELLANVNRGIAKIKANGTLDAILKKWKII